MRFVILLDLKIDKDEALSMLDSYSDFIEEHTGIEPTFWVERRDFSIVPTVADSDGDLKPTYQYRQDLCKSVHDRYGDYGTDYVVMWVHEDNFLYKGVWGTAWSYTHFKYNFLLCRWAKSSAVNTFNTFFHEGEHPHNTTIKKELGIDINPLIAQHFGYETFDFDKDYVHGNHPDWQYIGRRGYERDGRMLQFLAPYLRKAFETRRERHFEPVKAVQWKIIKLLRSILARRG